MKTKQKKIIAIAVIIFILLFVVVAIFKFHKVENCTDSGGSYDFKTNVCDLTNTRKK